MLNTTTIDKFKAGLRGELIQAGNTRTTKRPANFITP